MIELNVYDFNTSTPIKTLKLKKEVFCIEPHDRAIFDVIISQQSNLRQGTHQTKDKSQVRGGGRKPWKQKGTGRARQGSIRAPQWKGGGIVFGPTINKNYEKKVNKKVMKLAFKSMLSKKIKDNNIIVVNNFELDDHKTSKISKLIAQYKATNPLFIIEEHNNNLMLGVRNIPRTDVLYSGEVKVLDLTKFGSIFLTLDTLKKFERVLI